MDKCIVKNIKSFTQQNCFFFQNRTEQTKEKCWRPLQIFDLHMVICYWPKKNTLLEKFIIEFHHRTLGTHFFVYEIYKKSFSILMLEILSCVCWTWCMLGKCFFFGSFLIMTISVWFSQCVLFLILHRFTILRFVQNLKIELWSYEHQATGISKTCWIQNILQLRTQVLYLKHKCISNYLFTTM